MTNNRVKTAWKKEEEEGRTKRVERNCVKKNEKGEKIKERRGSRKEKGEKRIERTSQVIRHNQDQKPDAKKG